jgi:hypothetical protein
MPCCSALANLAAWTHFNLLHRRMNRKANLVLSTSCAMVLLLIAVFLLRDGRLRGAYRINPYRLQREFFLAR